MLERNRHMLNRLLNGLPHGLLVDSAWLQALGISRTSIHDYVQRGWLERVAPRVYRRAKATGTTTCVRWEVAALSAQRIRSSSFYVGGLTALKLHGHGPFARMGGGLAAHLYDPASTIPAWLSKLPVDAKLIVHKRALFSVMSLGVDWHRLDLGTTRLGAVVQSPAEDEPWDYFLRVASAERASIEIMEDVPQRLTFDHADAIFEGLTTLRPRIVTKLLEDCSSIRVKRLFLFFADRHGHDWVKQVDRNSINLGLGKRQLVAGGRLNARYQITVPASYDEAQAQRGSEFGQRALQRRLVPPAERTENLLRERPLALLNEGRAHKLTILVGPPGFGKTTSLSQWWRRSRVQGQTMAWYTASELDREPARFLEMIALAFAEAQIDMSRALMRQSDDGTKTATLLDAILLELDRAAKPVALIIDDFDKIENRAITTLIEDFLRLLPDQLHVIIAARREPLISMSALRAQGAVRVVDPAELRLTAAEIAALLDLPAESDAVAIVHKQTEGWPVAVEFYRIWRERAGDSANAPRFSGQTDEVAEYLTEHVLSLLSPEQRTLLTDLALLETVETALADHVRGRSDSRALLEEAQAAISILVQQTQLPGKAIAYRLHPLVRDYAQSELQHDAERAALMRSRAAKWFWDHHRYADAIRQAVIAEDRHLLDRMLGQVPLIQIFLVHGTTELRAMLREMPDELVEVSPRLQLMAALVQFKLGFFGAGLVWLQRIEERTDGFRVDPAGRADQLFIEGSMLTLYCHFQLEGVQFDCEPLVRDIQLAAADQPLVCALAESAMIILHQMRGDLAASRRAIMRTREIYETQGMLVWAKPQLRNLEILVELAHGSLRKAAGLAATMLRKDEPQSGGQTIAGMARIAVATIDYLRHYREATAEIARLAFDQFGDADAWFDQYALVSLIVLDVVWRRHGHGSVQMGIAEFRDRLHERGISAVDGFIDALEAIYHIRAGKLDLASASVASFCKIDPKLPWRERDLKLQARVLLHIARGASLPATNDATALLADAREGQRLVSVVKSLVLLALAADLRRDADEAEASMREAVYMAYPEGLVAPFTEEGAAIAKIVERVAAGLSGEFERRHVELILKLLRSPSQSSATVLNDRETEIMAQLAEGASNKRIARRLGLTENTIKFHLKKVFVKLGVQSRKAAVARMLQDGPGPTPARE